MSRHPIVTAGIRPAMALLGKRQNRVTLSRHFAIAAIAPARSLQADHGIGMPLGLGGTFQAFCTAGRAAMARYQRLTFG
jgi:hypothetical protein